MKARSESEKQNREWEGEANFSKAFSLEAFQKLFYIIYIFTYFDAYVSKNEFRMLNYLWKA